MQYMVRCGDEHQDDAHEDGDRQQRFLRRHGVARRERRSSQFESTLQLNAQPNNQGVTVPRISSCYKVARIHTSWYELS
eukprot:366492-Chlamydomonas_euryale.AAC.9